MVQDGFYRYRFSRNHHTAVYVQLLFVRQRLYGSDDWSYASDMLTMPYQEVRLVNK